MTQDIKLIQDDQGLFDISFEDGDIAKVNSLDTAIYVSLFTDARAPANLVTIPEHRRGWIVNSVSFVKDRDLGGLVWLLDQRRLTQDTLNDAVNYSRKALNWLIEDGLTKQISTFGEIVPRLGIRLVIRITNLNGVIETKYYELWKNTGVS